jgi:hypothetical protein
MTDPHRQTLITTNCFTDPDGAFRALVEAHRGLSDEASADLNARLVLLLANHVGDINVLKDAIKIALETSRADTNKAE